MTKWRGELGRQQDPLDSSLMIIDGLHQRWALLLESMTEEDFQNANVNPEGAKQNLGLDWRFTHGIALPHRTHHGAGARKGW